VKIKTTIIFILMTLLLLPAAGCSRKPQDLHTGAQQSIPPETGVNNDITDPVQLEQLWQEYFYDSIATVGNTREFNSAQEIDPLNVAQFCWLKYVEEHGWESLEPADEDSSLRLFPLDTALEYARRYFNLTSMDVSAIEPDIYDPQRRAFMFNLGGERARPSYHDPNAWGYSLDQVAKNSDGSVTFILTRSVSPQKDLVEMTETYTLKQREDGSLYFDSGKRDYVNNHLVSLTGDYQRFDQIIGFGENPDALSMLGEVEGSLILAYAPYDKGQNAALMLVDPETMTVEKRLEIKGNFSPADVSAAGESMIIRLNDKFIAVDKTLRHVEDIPLPGIIAAKINREPQYDGLGHPDVFFGGWDVSGDRKSYVYADEVGLKLLNTVDNSEKLLAETAALAGGAVPENSFHHSPRFVADGKKVVTTMLVYEGATGYMLYDLAKGTAQNYGIASQFSSTGLIRYDSGLLEINSYLPDPGSQSDDYKTVYLDFKSGELQEISLEDTGDTGHISIPDHCYVGPNHAAFITFKLDQTDNTNNMFYLHRLNLKTWLIEAEIISVKAADTHILGVLADGRIVFRYNLNPSENGVCITAK
jgi:hypothetical protein